jgi:hypothetical protein
MTGKTTEETAECDNSFRPFSYIARSMKLRNLWAKGLVFFITAFSLQSGLQGQNFGSSMDMLIKETNARTAALGGFNVSLQDDDVQMVNGNPALANGSMKRSLGMSYNPSLAGIRQYNTAYCDSLPVAGILFGTVQFLDFGSFRQTDAAGVENGNFTASQYAASLGTARRKGNFKLGAALKFSSLQINGLQASAILADLGVSYKHPTKDLSYGLSIRNLGFQAAKFYSDGQRIPMPLNIQAGFSYKLSHMPLRLSGTAFYLQETDIQYLDPNTPGKLDANGQLVKEKKKFTEQIARHLCLGGEFLLNRSFHLRVGYNHLRRKELRTETGAGLTGFSLGFMINTKPLNLAYTYSGWQNGTGLHFLSLNLRLQSFLKKGV